jgi:homoserine kinase
MTTATLVRARAFAPGSVGNVGPGLDILGLALAGAGDEVLVERVEASGVVVRDAGHGDLPIRADKNTAALATAEVLRRAGSPVRGLAVSVRKGLPLSGGQGGSAASAVAAAVATNRLLGDPLDRSGLLDACLTAEETVAGRHADNVAPSLFGGMVLVRSLAPIDVICLPVPGELRIVLAHPNQRLRTREARAVLPRKVPLDVALAQAAQIGAMVAALASDDYELLGRALEDRIAEPARAPLLPGFHQAKAAALSAGALGASISGAGPTAFALVRGDEIAQAVAAAMEAAYRSVGVVPQVRVAQVDRQGAREVP